MLSKEWQKLKSGSDIRGTAVDADINQPIELTDKVIEKITKSFLIFLNRKLNKPAEELKIAVGNDSRLSALRIKTGVINALKSCGVIAFDCGLATTPAMFTTTVKEPFCDAAIMITASHLPYDKNGLKFFTKAGSLESEDITEILSCAESGNLPDDSKSGELKILELISSYSKDLVEFIREKTGEEKPLSGLKIIVDAGNGAGGFFAEKVLWPLGADTDGSQFLIPDGNFPNHAPNPENREAMEAVCNAVKLNKADFGVIFDADVDRAGAVFASGKGINRNILIALISKILLSERKGGYIVTDSITSDGLTEFIESSGGIHHRFKRGYKNVINEAIRLNNSGRYCPLAIETSGHAAFKENYFLDDGAYLIVRILIYLNYLKKNGGNLEDEVKGLVMPKEETELRIKFNTEDFVLYGNNILEKLCDYCLGDFDFKMAKDNFEGVRVSFDKNNGDGWFLLRLSLHDPIMVLNVESNVIGGNKIITKKLYGFLESFDKLDLKNLEEFIK